MNPSPEPSDRAVANATRELARLNGQVVAMRAVLVGLLQDVVAAEQHQGGSEVAQLLEANEELVVAALRNQRDVETATQALDEASKSAGLDALTQLPNRVLLLDRLTSAIAIARRHGARLGLLFVDLDNFKQINDTLGHAVGDEALKRLASCLASAVRAADTVSRYGGDEFLVLLTEVSHGSDAILVADKMIALISAPSHIGDHVLRMTASIGISIYPDDGDDALTLIERADAAMYHAKRQGLGRSVFQADAHSGKRNRHVSAAGAPPQLEARHPQPPHPDHESRQAHLQEANEQLVLAVLEAQQLQTAAQSAQRRQTELVRVIAQELRNPMAPIRIAAAQLGRARTDEPLPPRAQALIERQAAHMSQWVSDLLDASLGGSTELKLECQQIDVTGFIETAIDSCRAGMDARGQQLRVHTPPGVLEVQGDPVRLAQVVSKLLDNASRCSPDGGKVGLSVEVAGEAVVITVSDSGIGNTEEELARVFDPVVQNAHALGFDSIGTGTGVGVGVGLPVVKQWVEAHGGSVVATSQGRGRGSQFVLKLPLALARAHDPHRSAGSSRL